MASAEHVTVMRRAGAYLVGNKTDCVCADLDENELTPVLKTQSFLAHSLGNDPWEVVADHSKLPSLVQEAIKRFRNRNQ